MPICETLVLIMKCNLCLEEKPLIKKSHIIPDFLYDGIYDEKHFLHIWDVVKMEPAGKAPTGIYDRHILCEKCDNELIGKLETYARKVFFGGEKNEKLKPLFEAKAPDRLTIENIDYSKFKLFLLSILWRAHISSNTFFKNIELGPYAEQIREMLANNDPGEEDQLETCIIFYNEKTLPSQSVATPRKIKGKGNTCYHFLINHMSIWFNMSNIDKLEMFKHTGLRKNNTMELYVVQGERAKKLFKKSTGINLEL